MATYSNYDSATLSNGVILTVPIIANGSYCVLRFESNATHAGEVRTVTIGSNSVKVTLDSYGNGSMSLMPFMRADAVGNNLQDNPCVSTNYWRGSLSVVISGADTTDAETTKTVYYILGDCPPRETAITEVWRTYNMGMATNYNVLTVDWADHYTSGVPNNLSAFRASSTDPSTWTTPPENDNDIVRNVQQVNSTVIVTGDVVYHFTTDKRTENIIQVRWIDSNGNLNTRKFTPSSDTYTAAVGTSWKRFRDSKVIVSHSYDYGSDEWANVTAQRTLTFGDDAIPMGQWEWLCSLASAQVVELYEDSVWKRCNIVAGNQQRDPRKAVFTATYTIIVPTAENVEM